MRGKEIIVESHMKKLNNRPGSQDTNTLRYTSSSSGHPGHTRRHPQHSSTLPKRLPGSWWTLCGFAHGSQADACLKRRKFSSLLRTRGTFAGQTIFELRNKGRLTLFGDRQAVAHTQPQRATKTPPTPTPQVRKTLPALPLACRETCSQPTNNSSRVAFRRS